MSIPTPVNNSGTTRRLPVTCYRCGEPGHISRNCLNGHTGYNSRNSAAQQPYSARIRGATGVNTQTNRSYLEVKINKRIHHCLLDTGYEITVLSAGIASGSAIRPSSQRLLAANGTRIPILGRTTVKAQVGEQYIHIDGLVSEAPSKCLTLY